MEWEIKVPSKSRKREESKATGSFYQFADCTCPKCHTRHVDILKMVYLKQAERDRNGFVIAECDNCKGGK